MAYISFGGFSARDKEDSSTDEPIKSLQIEKESTSQPIKLLQREEEEKVSKTEMKKAPRRESKYQLKVEKDQRKKGKTQIFTLDRTLCLKWLANWTFWFASSLFIVFGSTQQ